jgi:ubiquitin-conjugating enzyme E2 Z
MNANDVISKDTVHRIVHDVKDMLTNSLKSHGIYYKHDEEDMLKGYALIIGPKDTPYQYGFYFFKVNFPKDYPHSPLVFTFLNRDKFKTRFHPNLYRNGKCCLSVLNTWVGEQWSSCQSLKSILLTLITIFTNDPLLNEPGITRSHPDFNSYNKVITYRNIENNFINCIKKYNNDPIYKKFDDIIKDLFDKNKNAVIEIIDHNINIQFSYNITIYNMIGSCNYKDLKSNFKYKLKLKNV